MGVLQWAKSQVICLMILMYISIIYIRDGHKLNKISRSNKCNYFFDATLIAAELAILFDGITAVTVNFDSQIPIVINIILHYAMFASYEVFMMLLYLYWVTVTGGLTKRVWLKAVHVLLCAATLILTAAFMPQVEYIHGELTNYSMGASVYICFAFVGLYCLLTLLLIFARRKTLKSTSKYQLGVSLLFIIVILAIQIAFPEYLISSMAVTMLIVSTYITMENPSIKSLDYYHSEMVYGFATLVENRDDNTGEHIRRSSAYAVLIAKNLRRNKKYRTIITRDYLDDIAKSAPMHDVGKIGIPDSILQKPGKLTEEEFNIMKTHPIIGAAIIQDTFGHLEDGAYFKMAFDIAKYHHEKWNGKGYPEGLKETEIPLCARIMAVADVFDAVSAKRCYRDALPLNVCYDIIRKGSGIEFDPEIVDAFFYDMEAVGNIYSKKERISKH